MEAWSYIYSLLPNLGTAIDEGLRSALAGWAAYLLLGLINITVIIGFVFTVALAQIWLERRLVGRFQIRIGPNRVGWQGVLQPVADALKLLLKEDVIPERGDSWVFRLAPAVAFFPAIMVYAVLPFSSGAVLADLNIGILYVVSITTLGIIGIFMAGWSSNNKYSLLGAMRAVAQMVSYEVPLVLSVIGVVMIAGSLSMVSIVEAQTVPFILLQPLGFLGFFLAANAELNRTPFDIMEAESEIVAGYHIEYSGMRFALFYLTELVHAWVFSALVATLFLGGWTGWVLPPFVWFLIKTGAVYLVLIWTRATFPRLRIDQLMGFAWKFLFPVALLNLFITGAEIILFPDFPWPLALVNWAIAVALIVLWYGLSGVGKVTESQRLPLRDFLSGMR